MPSKFSPLEENGGKTTGKDIREKKDWQDTLLEKSRDQISLYDEREVQEKLLRWIRTINSAVYMSFNLQKTASINKSDEPLTRRLNVTTFLSYWVNQEILKYEQNFGESSGIKPHP